MNPANSGTRPPWKMAAATIVLLVIVGPLFVCMPVNSDTALYDVQADRLLKHGVLYRDIVEPNLPGAVWIQLAVRTIAGWSSEAMRFADLLIFGGMLLIFSRISGTVARGLAFCFPALLFYLSCNEWCHCQRDTWMLFPTAAAVWLRCRRQSDASATTFSFSGSRIFSCVAEGFFWGCAFWLKPHIAIPAGCVILHDIAASRNRTDGWRCCGLVIAGGILAAVPGIVWMVSSGTWPHFLEMMLGWNPEYLQAGRERQSIHRWLLMFRRFYPWWFAHIVAAPIALQGLLAVWKARSEAEHTDRRIFCVVASLYLGWLLQSLALQHAMDYIHVPAIILGILLLTITPWRLPAAMRRACVTAFCTIAVLASPLVSFERLSQWTNCLNRGSATEVRASLAHGNFPQWSSLAEVSSFLKRQNVQDGDVTCVNVHSIHILRDLGVQPTTRYWCSTILQELFPSRAAQIAATVRSGGGKFIVTETKESGFEDSERLPNKFPWNLPVVFQAGTYRVHDATAVSDRKSLVSSIR